MDYTTFDLVPPASVTIQFDPLEQLQAPLFDVSSPGQKHFQRTDRSSNENTTSSNDEDTWSNEEAGSTEVTTENNTPLSDCVVDDEDDDYDYENKHGFITELSFGRRRVLPVRSSRKSLLTERLLVTERLMIQGGSTNPQEERREVLVRIMSPAQSKDQLKGLEIQREEKGIKIARRREYVMNGKYAVIYLDRPQAVAKPRARWLCCNCFVLNSGHELRCSFCKSHTRCSDCEVAVPELDGDLELEI